MKKRGGSKKTKKSGRRRLKNPPKAKRKSRLRFWFKAHGGATAFFLVSYLVLGLMISPDFLRKDHGDKYGKVAGAVHVSVLVRGMPQKPFILATSGCNGSYPYVNLDWADDLGVDTFDVWRDGAILVAGLTSSGYRDSNVNALSNYGYYVVANGPVGTKQSDTVTIQASECYTPPPPPPPVNISSLTIGGADLTNYHCCPQIKETKPLFSGETNVSRARVTVGIQSGRRGLISTFSANRNGYWSWRPRNKLSRGLKTFYLSIADPNDASRVVSTSFQFRIAKRKLSKKVLEKCLGGSVLEKITYGVHPFFSKHFASLSIENQRKALYPGEVLGFSLFPENRLPPSGGVPYKLAILDSRGNSIYQENRESSEQGRAEDLGIGRKIAPGKYRLIAEYPEGSLDISAEDNFEVKEKPIFILGSGLEITSRQLISNLGWAAFFSLGLLGMFLFLLFFEYHLSKRALVQITGSDLKKKGMID